MLFLEKRKKIVSKSNYCRWQKGYLKHILEKLKAILTLGDGRDQSFSKSNYF